MLHRELGQDRRAMRTDLGTPLTLTLPGLGQVSTISLPTTENNMDRELLLKLWDESWDQGIWIAPWSKAVQGLSPKQAAWSPAADRHCIWQIVHHVCIWREYTLTAVDGRSGPSRKEVESGNFAMPASRTAVEWRRSVDRLQATHNDIRAAIATASSLERLQYHLGHDCYHLGQIMYLRATQGMGPIE